MVLPHDHLLSIPPQSLNISQTSQPWYVEVTLNALIINITSFRRKVLKTFSFHTAKNNNVCTVALNVQMKNGNVGYVVS
jgi:hypothetical protein